MLVCAMRPQEMNTYWKIYASPPGDSLSLTITSEDKEHGAHTKTAHLLHCSQPPQRADDHPSRAGTFRRDVLHCNAES